MEYNLKRLTLMLLLVLVTSNCGRQPARDDSSQPTIYGGTAVPAGKWEQVVAVAQKHGEDFFLVCTGTLLTPHFVLTAGHCVSDILQDGGPSTVPGRSLDELAIVTGSGIEGGKVAPDVTRIPVKNAYHHEFLRALPRGNADIAILELAAPITLPKGTPYGRSILPINFRATSQILQPSTMLTMIGYGLREDNGRGQKFSVTTPLRAHEATEAKLGGEGKDSCSGDSGGPVFHLQEQKNGQDKATLLGVISRGVGVGCGNGGIVTLVSSYLCWIQEKTNVQLETTENRLACNHTQAPYPDKKLATLSWLRICSQKHNPIATQHTLDVIKAKMATSSCQLAGQRLSESGALDLSNSRLKDLSPLANLPNLRSLNLAGNELTDISVVSSLPNLMSVDLSYNDVADFSPVDEARDRGLMVRGMRLQKSNFTATNFAKLCDNPSNSPSVQKTLRAVRGYFMTGDCKHANLQLARATKLRLARRDLVDLTPLSDLQNLTELDLSGNPLNDISALSGLENLKLLDLRGTQVNDLTPLVELLHEGLQVIQ